MIPISCKICRQTIPLKEHSILTAYSAIVNFFGPLQSGPGFRSVYLKKKHNVSLHRYATVTLFYYAFFGILSGVFLLSGSPKLLAVAIIGSLVLLGTAGLYTNHRWPRLRKRFVTRDNIRLMTRLGIGTLLQITLVTTIYWSELRSIDATISLGQAVIYTGAANFALFVSLTPGALGFRESFLFFSQNLHHISNSTIISANVIDRAVYVSFLGMLFLGTLAVHAKSRLGVKNLKG